MNTRSYAARRFGIVAVLGAVTLVAGACGGSDSKSSDSKPESGGSLGTLTVITSISQSAPFIGIESIDSDPSLNPWKASGLTVKFVAGTTATVTPALASGSADIGVTAANVAGLAAAKGVDTKIPACIMTPWRQNIIAKKGISSIGQLKGKTFGISAAGSAGAYAQSQVVAKQGWKKTDVKTQALGTLPALQAALQNGTIDAFVWSPEVAIELQDKGVAKDLGSVKDLVGPNCFESFQIRSELMEKRPEAVKAFFDGYFKNVAYLKSHPEVAKDILINKWSYNATTVGKFLTEALDSLSSDGKISPTELGGVLKSTQDVAPNATKDQIDKTYSYWGDL